MNKGPSHESNKLWTTRIDEGKNDTQEAVEKCRNKIENGDWKGLFLDYSSYPEGY